MKIVLLGTALSALMGVVIGTSLNPHLDQPDPSGSYVLAKTLDPVEVAEAAPAVVQPSADTAVYGAPPSGSPPNSTVSPVVSTYPGRRSDDLVPQVSSPTDAGSDVAKPSRPSPAHPEQTLYAAADSSEEDGGIDAVERPRPVLARYTTSDPDPSSLSSVAQP